MPLFSASFAVITSGFFFLVVSIYLVNSHNNHIEIREIILFSFPDINLLQSVARHLFFLPHIIGLPIIDGQQCDEVFHEECSEYEGLNFVP